MGGDVVRRQNSTKSRPHKSQQAQGYVDRSLADVQGHLTMSLALMFWWPFTMLELIARGLPNI